MAVNQSLTIPDSQIGESSAGSAMSTSEDLTSHGKSRRLEKGQACVECKARKKVRQGCGVHACLLANMMPFLMTLAYSYYQRCDAVRPICSMCLRQSTECVYDEYDRTRTRKLREKIQSLEQKLKELVVGGRRPPAVVRGMPILTHDAHRDISNRR